MKPEARRTLATLHTLRRCEDYITCARAELASDPDNDRLRAFVAMIENLLVTEKQKLLATD